MAVSRPSRLRREVPAPRLPAGRADSLLTNLEAIREPQGVENRGRLDRGESNQRARLAFKGLSPAGCPFPACVAPAEAAGAASTRRAQGKGPPRPGAWAACAGLAGALGAESLLSGTGPPPWPVGGRGRAAPRPLVAYRPPALAHARPARRTAGTSREANFNTTPATTVRHRGNSVSQGNSG
jgi:hypothetical protein